MIFNILTVISFILSSLCTMFLGIMVYASTKQLKSTKHIFKRR